MKTIIVVGCANKKKSYPCEARELYSESQLFSKTVAYINSYYNDSYVILSAKYGVVSPTRIIEPYDVSMKQISPEERKFIISTIRYTLGMYPKIIALCGSDYVKVLKEALPDACVIEPMKGMGIGQRLHFLTERCSGV